MHLQKVCIYIHAMMLCEITALWIVYHSYINVEYPSLNLESASCVQEGKIIAIVI